jgi:hypothetical protein
MPVPPDLTDPAQRAAYRAELLAYRPWLRRSAVGLAVIGALYAIARVRLSLDWPAWPGRAAVVIGVALMLTAIALRSRYHRARMRGLR